MASSKKAMLNLKAVGQRQGRLDHVALVQWIARSDEPALAQFYNATSGLLFGLLLHALRDTTTAEEILSRVYTDIRQDAAPFPKRRICLLVWLITIAHWHAMEHLRLSKDNERFAGLVGPREHSRKSLQKAGMNRLEHQRMVSATLAALSPMQLQMIELAYFSRLAPLEIALRLGQRLETVKVGLQDGMSKLCTLFKSDFPDTGSKRGLSRVA